MNKTDRTRLRELAERYPKPFYVQKFVEKLELHDHNGSEIRSTHAAELIALACNSVLPLLTRVEELEKALEDISLSACSCHSNDDPDWHSTRCFTRKAVSALRGEEER